MVRKPRRGQEPNSLDRVVFENQYEEQSVRMNYWPRVAVPARNEATRLKRLFTSLSNQSWQSSTGRQLPLVIALNNCDDGSRQVLDDLVPRFPELDVMIADVSFVPPAAHVGSARRLAMEMALQGAAEIGRASCRERV